MSQISPFQAFLLGGACLSLLGLAVSGVLVSRAQQDRDRRKARVESVIAHHTRVPRIELTAFTTATDDGSQGSRRKLSRIFGFDPEKRALYPVKWWLVLIVTLILARIIQYVTADFLGVLSWLLLPVVWVLMSRQYFAWIEERRRTLLLSQFPDALSMIVRAIRVGVPIMESVRIVSRETPHPTAGEFARLVDQVAVGASIEDGVLELARRSGLPEYRFFATALALQTQTGGTLSDTLESLADVIRKRAALKSRGRALTAEARSSSMILAMLPFGTGLLLYAMNPPYMTLLFTNPTGKTLLGIAVVSLSVGMLMIRTMIRKSLPR